MNRNSDKPRHSKGPLLAVGALILATLPGLSSAAGGGKHGRAGEMLRHFDSNGDRVITAVEVAAVNAAEMQANDSNTDGSLSLAEFEKLWLARMRERMVDRFQKLDADGDGQITDAEFKRPSDRLMTWVDRDGDQQVTVEELRQMRGKGRHRGERGQKRHRRHHN